MQNSMDMSDFNLENNTTYSFEELAAIALQNFTHVVLLVNGESMGVYTLPAKIPVLASDSTRLYIMPCIKMDGMATSIRNYEGIVDPCITTIFLKKGETYTFKDNPIRFKYKKNVQIPLLETFSNSTVFKPDTATSSIPIILESIDGQNVGSITVHNKQTLFEIMSSEMVLPSQEDLFFEMDYKCSQELFVEIDLLDSYGIWNVRSLIGVRPSDTWNKIYVNLSKVVANVAEGNATITGRMRISGNSMDEEQAKFYFDNMKVIYVK
jgi:hypothetical protein